MKPRNIEYSTTVQSRTHSSIPPYHKTKIPINPISRLSIDIKSFKPELHSHHSAVSLFLHFLLIKASASESFYSISSSSGIYFCGVSGTAILLLSVPEVVTNPVPSSLLCLAHTVSTLQIVLEGSRHFDYLLQMFGVEYDPLLVVTLVFEFRKGHCGAESYVQFEISVPTQALKTETKLYIPLRISRPFHPRLCISLLSFA